MTELVLPCTTVLFDSDGVLVDSEASVVAAWASWARAYGLDPEQVLALVHGQRAVDTVGQLVGTGPDARAALERINALELQSAQTVRALPGARELTGSIDAARWAVVTSGTRALARQRLAAAQLWPVATLVAAEDIPAGKPAPDGYLLAARRLGSDTASAVVVEDAPNGVEAARRAGVAHVVGVGERAAGTDADVVITDLRGLSWTVGGLRVRSTHVIR